MQRRGRDWIVAVGGICLLLSAGLNVALAMRLSAQRALLESGGAERQEMLGRQMQPLEAADPSGRPVRVEFGSDGRPTVLYAFRPGCLWCERNHEALLALHAKAADRYRFVGLSLESNGLAEYLERFPLPFEVVTDLDAATVESYKLGGTPRTLIVNPEGVIEENFVGAWTARMGVLVGARFGVDLPAVKMEVQ